MPALPKGRTVNSPTVLDREGREIVVGAEVCRVLGGKPLRTRGRFLGLSGDRSSVGVEWQLEGRPNSVRFLPAERHSVIRRTRTCPDLLVIDGPNQPTKEAASAAPDKGGSK